MLIRFTLTLFILSLSGCASKQVQSEIIYYLLDTSIPTQNTRTVTTTKIVFNNLTLAAYLEQPNLVLRQSDHTVRIANYHVWAEPLHKAIKRAISNDLVLVRPDISVVNVCGECNDLAVTIDHFYPDSDGLVTLSGHYSITESTQPTSTHSFALTKSIDTDGYEASIVTMRSLVTQLTELIATDLK